MAWRVDRSQTIEPHYFNGYGGPGSIMAAPADSNVPYSPETAYFPIATP